MGVDVRATSGYGFVLTDEELRSWAEKKLGPDALDKWTEQELAFETPDELGLPKGVSVYELGSPSYGGEAAYAVLADSTAIVHWSYLDLFSVSDVPEVTEIDKLVLHRLRNDIDAGTRIGYVTGLTWS